ncbi:hypothetical protein C1646_753042 [Rhizophagus diaphanus]|nr:hypothetical protein C1646_753042 [Rhizophagus diaphanus] [Rhizophagus sp. MUCL 43196]
MEQYFELIYQTCFESNSLLELQQYCTNFMAKFPEKIFKSLDFISLSEKSLISLIKRDDLQMKEIEIWDHVLKWGLEKNPTLLPDPTTWSDDDFKMMKNTLRGCLLFIRFYSLSSEDLSQKVRPCKKLLNRQLYEELLESYLNPNGVPNDNILLPRSRNIDGIIDSKIVNLNIASLISRWINKIDIKSKYAYARELYLPYKFNLLLRGKRDGFTPKKFHELCDNKLYSFIFSFKSKNIFRDSILSNVIDVNYAMYYGDNVGPTFGRDIDIHVELGNGSKEYNYCQCKQKYYERGIRDKDDLFLIEDYEVFQIIKKND